MLALRDGAQRKVQHLDREPSAQGRERAVDDGVVPAREPDLRVCTVDDLANRLEERRGVVDRRERGEADGETLGEWRVRVGSRGERPEERPDGPVARRNRVEHVRERRATRPPELVGVGVDHPVRTEVGCRQPGHARDPLVLPQIVAVLADEVDVPLTCVALEHVRRPVLRAVVGRDDEIGARVQVKREPGLDDIRLVAREECHDERHRRGSVRRRARRASSAATRCSALTMPSIPTRTEASAA